MSNHNLASHETSQLPLLIAIQREKKVEQLRWICEVILVNVFCDEKDTDNNICPFLDHLFLDLVFELAIRSKQGMLRYFTQ